MFEKLIQTNALLTLQNMDLTLDKPMIFKKKNCFLQNMFVVKKCLLLNINSEEHFSKRYSPCSFILVNIFSFVYETKNLLLTNEFLRYLF